MKLLCNEVPIPSLPQVSVVQGVVGGRKTKPHKYPWLTYLEIVTHEGGESRCGGTLISPRHAEI